MTHRRVCDVLGSCDEMASCDILTACDVCDGKVVYVLGKVVYTTSSLVHSHVRSSFSSLASGFPV